MKLKYLFPLIISALIVMVSCENEEAVTLLDEIRVSSSYVSIDSLGGSTSITLSAQDSWVIEKVITKSDSVKWLNVSPMNGSSGDTEIKFSASSNVSRTAEVLIKSGGKTQIVKIIQGSVKVKKVNVAEANAGPDGKTFRLTGVCTSIVDTEYGNWYLTDATGTMYIYGTLDEKGGKKNFLSLELEVGDEVTIEGPKSTYNGSPQMKDVTVVEINKSLVKVDSIENELLPIEGGEFIAYLTCKGQGVSVEIPEDAKSWLSISSIQSAGTNAVVKFTADANAGGDRGTTITFSTTDGKKEYTTETTLNQKGAIIKASIAEFIAAAVGDTQYRLTGVITKIDAKYNNNINISDFSGETYVYRLDLGGKEYKVGDIVTVVGKRGEYNGAQLANGILESVIPVTPATIAEVLTKADSKEIYYMVTGEITEVEHKEYGRLYLKDGDNSIYVYGCSPGYGATGNDRNNMLADKEVVVGDTLTVIGTKGSYDGVAQLANGIYFSHESAE